MEEKETFSIFCVESKNEDSSAVLFNGQSITFCLSNKEVCFVLALNKGQKQWKNHVLFSLKRNRKQKFSSFLPPNLKAIEKKL